VTGAPGWIRTNRLPGKNRVLYQMSYGGMEATLGVEPSTKPILQTGSEPARTLPGKRWGRQESNLHQCLYVLPGISPWPCEPGR
jgi:hypothetical protein